MVGRFVALAAMTLFLAIPAEDARGQGPAPRAAPPGAAPGGPPGATPPGATPPGGSPSGPQGSAPRSCTPADPPAPPTAMPLESPTLAPLGTLLASDTRLAPPPCVAGGGLGVLSGSAAPISSLSGGLAADLLHGLQPMEFGRAGTGFGSAR